MKKILFSLLLLCSFLQAGYFEDLESSAASSSWDETMSCVVCMERKPKGGFTYLLCGHEACNACLNSIVSLALNSKNISGLRCPHSDCFRPFSEEDIRSITYDHPEKLRIYSNLMLSQWLAQQEKIKNCPGKDCSFSFIDEREEPIIIACECGEKFCSKCLLNHSLVITCQEAQSEKYKGLTEEQIKALKATDEWLTSNTKPCPRCQVPIERSGGCDYMQCKKCHYGFCWKCLGPHDHNMHGHRCK